MTDQTELLPVVTFKFVEFNPRRHSRCVEAARVEVLEDGEPCADCCGCPSAI